MKIKYLAITQVILFCSFFAIGQIANAQISIPERFVQIRSIDFSAGVLELRNFGGANEPLAGWRFCSHDESDDRQYSASGGLNSVVLGPGASLFVHFNNDADAGEPSQMNISSIGGNFAQPLDTAGAYAIQIFYQTPFGNGDNIADHVQFSLGGVDNTTADERSDEAQNGGVWINQNQWVSVQADTESIVLIDDSAANELHGPSDYIVNIPMGGLIGDVNCDGSINLLDVGPFVQLLSNGLFDVKADINEDGTLNLLDVGPFVDLLAGG